MKKLALRAHLLAAAALSLSVALSALAQSAGTQPSPQRSQAQPPSSQNIEELSQKLVELEKEAQALRQSIKRLEEAQKRKQLEEQQKREARQEPQPSSTQPPGAAGAQSPGQRRRPISGVAKQETVSHDRETVARIDNQPLDPELIGFFNIPGAKAKVKIDGYAKLDVMVDPRPAGDRDEFINTTFPVNLTPPQKVVMSNVSFRQPDLASAEGVPFHCRRRVPLRLAGIERQLERQGEPGSGQSPVQPVPEACNSGT